MQPVAVAALTIGGTAGPAIAVRRVAVAGADTVVAGTTAAELDCDCHLATRPADSTQLGNYWVAN